MAAVADQRQERHTVVVWRGDHASLPSPSRGVYYLGPLPLHAYGLALAVGILVAARVTERRWVARGHPATEFGDLMIWVVVAGIVGARLYHVVSDFQLFTGDPWKIVAIWQGGLSIWGAVAGGAVGQAIGRSGNWFNQEIFGGPTTLPWGSRSTASPASGLRALRDLPSDVSL